MKISVLTPTYNRAKMLDRLYVSLIVNKNNSNIDIEWLIMDDGSTDETSTIINHYIGEKIIDIKYYKQVNQGKMTAINNLVDKATGDYIIECDSDDYLATGALDIIRDNADRLLKDDKGRNEYIGITITDERITPEINNYLKQLLASRGSILMELMSTFTTFSGPRVCIPA